MSDLLLAIKGTPEQLETARRPYQFQSQLWVAAMLLGGRLPLRVHPPTGQRSPDYLVTLGSRTYGLEVKRPTNRNAIEDAMRSARDQLKGQGLRGGIAIDLTDCVSPSLLFSFSDAPEESPYTKVYAEFEGLYRQCGEIVFDSVAKRHRKGFDRVVFIIALVNGWRWMRRGPKGPELFHSSQLGWFVSTRRNLDHWNVDKIQNAYESGMRAARYFLSSSG